MHDPSSTHSHADSVILDPMLRAYRRRYFIPATKVGVRRAFTAAGAIRIASRAPAAPRWAALKQKWDLAVEREQARRRPGRYRSATSARPS